MSRYRALRQSKYLTPVSLSDETGFSERDRVFGGLWGEILCAALGLLSFAYLIAHVAVAIARGLLPGRGVL